MKLSKRFVVLNTFMLATIGGSIFVNFSLFNQAKKYYIELNETRLDPIGLKYYPTKPQEVAGKRPVRVVFFGDSRAASWTAPKVSGYEFINRGISSQTSIQTIQRFSEHVSPLKPDVVVVQADFSR